MAYRSLKEYRAEYLAALKADPNDPRHGTTTGYTYGCNCDRCRLAAKKANVKRVRTKKPTGLHARWAAADARRKATGEKWAAEREGHGTLEKYAEGCRCRECRSARIRARVCGDKAVRRVTE